MRNKVLTTSILRYAATALWCVAFGFLFACQNQGNKDLEDGTMGLLGVAVSGSSQSATRNVVYSNRLKAQFVDSETFEPVVGASVTWVETTATNAVILTPYGTTDSSGYVETAVRSPNAYGELIKIEARMDGSSVKAVFTLTTETFGTGYQYGVTTTNNMVETAGQSFRFIIKILDDDGNIITSINETRELTWYFQNDSQTGLSSWGGGLPVIPSATVAQNAALVSRTYSCKFVNGECKDSRQFKLANALGTTTVLVGDSSSNLKPIFAKPITVNIGAAAGLMLASSKNNPKTFPSTIAYPSIKVNADESAFNVVAVVVDSMKNFKSALSATQKANLRWTSEAMETADATDTEEDILQIGTSVTLDETYNFEPKKAGHSVLTLSTSGGLLGSTNFSVYPGRPAKMKFAELPETIEAGSENSFDVVATDADGNALSGDENGLNVFTGSYEVTYSIQRTDGSDANSPGEDGLVLGGTLFPNGDGVAETLRFVKGKATSAYKLRINRAELDIEFTGTIDRGDEGDPLTGTATKTDSEDLIQAVKGDPYRINLYSAADPTDPSAALCRSTGESISNSSNPCKALVIGTATNIFVAYEDKGGNIVTGSSDPTGVALSVAGSATITGYAGSITATGATPAGEFGTLTITSGLTNSDSNPVQGSIKFKSTTSVPHHVRLSFVKEDGTTVYSAGVDGKVRIPTGGIVRVRAEVLDSLNNPVTLTGSPTIRLDYTFKDSSGTVLSAADLDALYSAELGKLPSDSDSFVIDASTGKAVSDNDANGRIIAQRTISDMSMTASAYINGSGTALPVVQADTTDKLVFSVSDAFRYQLSVAIDDDNDGASASDAGDRAYTQYSGLITNSLNTVGKEICIIPTMHDASGAAIAYVGPQKKLVIKVSNVQNAPSGEAWYAKRYKTGAAVVDMTSDISGAGYAEDVDVAFSSSTGVADTKYCFKFYNSAYAPLVQITSDNDFAAGLASFSLVADSPTHIRTLPNVSSVIASVDNITYTLTIRDQYGNVATNASPETINFNLSGAGAAFVGAGSPVTITGGTATRVVSTASVGTVSTTFDDGSVVGNSSAGSRACPAGVTCSSNVSANAYVATHVKLKMPWQTDNNPALGSQVLITGSNPSSYTFTAGSTFEVVAYAVDANGKLMDEDSKVVTLLSPRDTHATLGFAAANTGNVQKTFTDGKATFTVMHKVATPTSASDSEKFYLESSSDLIDAESAVYEVGPTTATKLLFSQIPSATFANGTAISDIKVTIADTYGNKVTSGTKTVRLNFYDSSATCAGGTVLSGTLIAGEVAGQNYYESTSSSGIATFSVSGLYRTSDEIYLGATDAASTLTAACSGVDVEHTEALTREFVKISGSGTLTHFTVTGSSTASAGSNYTVSIKAMDANENVVTTFNDPVDLSSTNATLMNTSNVNLTDNKVSVTLTNGIATQTIRFRTAGSARDLSVTDNAASPTVGSLASGVLVSPDYSTIQFSSVPATTVHEITASNASGCQVIQDSTPADVTYSFTVTDGFANAIENATITVANAAGSAGTVYSGAGCTGGATFTGTTSSSGIYSTKLYLPVAKGTYSFKYKASATVSGTTYSTAETTLSAIMNANPTPSSIAFTNSTFTTAKSNAATASNGMPTLTIAVKDIAGNVISSLGAADATMTIGAYTVTGSTCNAPDASGAGGTPAAGSLSHSILPGSTDFWSTGTDVTTASGVASIVGLKYTLSAASNETICLQARWTPTSGSALIANTAAFIVYPALTAKAGLAAFTPGTTYNVNTTTPIAEGGYGTYSFSLVTDTSANYATTSSTAPASAGSGYVPGKTAKSCDSGVSYEIIRVTDQAGNTVDVTLTVTGALKLEFDGNYYVHSGGNITSCSGATTPCGALSGESFGGTSGTPLTELSGAVSRTYTVRNMGCGTTSGAALGAGGDWMKFTNYSQKIDDVFAVSQSCVMAQYDGTPTLAASVGHDRDDVCTVTVTFTPPGSLGTDIDDADGLAIMPNFGGGSAQSPTGLSSFSIYYNGRL